MDFLHDVSYIRVNGTQTVDGSCGDAFPVELNPSIGLLDPPLPQHDSRFWFSLGHGMTATVFRRFNYRTLLLAVAAASLAGSCGQPATAGNATVDFMIALQQEDYDQAYDQLCDRLQRAWPPTEFSSSRGGDFALIDTLGGAPAVVHVEPPDPDTRRSSVTDAIVAVTGTGEDETRTLRIELVREGGRWRICEMLSGP